MFKKLKGKIRVNNEINVLTLLTTLFTGLAILMSIFWVYDQHTDNVAANTANIKALKEFQVGIVEDQKEAAKERRGQAIAMADMARLVDEIRRKLDGQ